MKIMSLILVAFLALTNCHKSEVVPPGLQLVCNEKRQYAVAATVDGRLLIPRRKNYDHSRQAAIDYAWVQYGHEKELVDPPIPFYRTAKEMGYHECR